MSPEKDGRTPVDPSVTEEHAVPLVSERLQVDVEENVTGRVRVATRTHTIEERVEETLRSTTADVVRVPIGRELQPGEPIPEVRSEAGVTIVPVLEEQLFVEKRLVLVEEVRIERVNQQQQVSAPITLRRQSVDIDRSDG